MNYLLSFNNTLKKLSYGQCIDENSLNFFCTLFRRLKVFAEADRSSFCFVLFKEPGILHKMGQYMHGVSNRGIILDFPKTRHEAGRASGAGRREEVSSWSARAAVSAGSRESVVKGGDDDDGSAPLVLAIKFQKQEISRRWPDSARERRADASILVVNRKKLQVGSGVCGGKFETARFAFRNMWEKLEKYYERWEYGILKAMKIGKKCFSITFFLRWKGKNITLKYKI